MNSNNKISIKLRNNDYIIKYSLNYFSGEINQKDLEALSSPVFDWTELTSETLKNQKDLGKFIFRIMQRFSKMDKKNKFPKDAFIFKDWQKNIKNLNQLEKITKVFQSLSKIEKFITEKIQLEKEIAAISDYRNDFKEMAKNSLFQSKKDLLSKLQTEFKEILPQYEIHRDEFKVHEEKMLKFKKDHEIYDFNQKKIKEQQRNFFREINKLTKKMDDVEPLLETYSDKLETLNPDGIDYQRIEGKFKSLKIDQNQLKDTRLELMQESKQLKHQLIKIKREFKKKSQDNMKFHSKYKEMEEKYLDLQHQHESLQEQISQTKIDIEELIAKKEQSQNGKISRIKSPYFSLRQLEDDFQNKSQRLKRISSKLKELFGTDVNLDIQNKINGKMQEIESKLEVLQKDTPKFKEISTLVSEFKRFYSFLDNLQSNLNRFLIFIGLSAEFHLTLKENKLDELKFSLSVSDSRKQIDFMEDLKRIERAFCVFALIISIYLSNDVNIIPIDLNRVIPEIKTPQTFIKSLELVDEVLSTSENNDNIHVLFFLQNNAFDVENIIELIEN
ncbi:MAG: hypothetical protein ACTSWL_06815 [Promethearchaeota archaeon]